MTSKAPAVANAIPSDRVRALADSVLADERAARVEGFPFDQRAHVTTLCTASACAGENTQQAVLETTILLVRAVRADLDERGRFAAAVAFAQLPDGRTIAYYGGEDVLVLDESANEVGRHRRLFVVGLDNAQAVVDALALDPETFAAWPLNEPPWTPLAP